MYGEQFKDREEDEYSVDLSNRRPSAEVQGDERREIHDHQDYVLRKSSRSGKWFLNWTPGHILICMLLLIIVYILSRPPKEPSNVLWQYKMIEVSGLALFDSSSKVISIDLEEFQQLGTDGWELCATIPYIETGFPNFGSEEYHTGIKSNTRTSKVVFLFKRPR